MAAFDRDSIAGVKILQTTGSITTIPFKGSNDGYSDANHLNFGQIIQNPTIDYSDFYQLFYDSYLNESVAIDNYTGNYDVTEGGGK